MSEHIKFYDDFTGFTFNGKHCSEFGLLRVSDGDRYEDNLVLSLSDEAADVPGGVGQYYWGEKIKERTFNIKIAYDCVTEKDKRAIKHWLHPDSQLHELIFDEKPYVKYWVKCSKQVAAKELCFNEGRKRIYKGEFDIEFTAYMPYGVNRWDSLPQAYKTEGEIPEEYGNIEEWAETSALPLYSELTIMQPGNFNTVTPYSLYTTIYNPGDVESGFTLTFNKSVAGNVGSYVGLESSPSSYYYPVSESEINIAETIYYIFSPYLSELRGTNTNANVILDGNFIDNGYIDLSKGYPVFISNNSGNVYDVCEYIPNDMYIGVVHYNFDSPLENNKKYYGISDGNIVSFYHSYGTVFCLDRNIEPDGLDDDILMLPDHDVVMKIELKHNDQTLPEHSFILKIPNGSTTNPKYWIEAQKMLYTPCQVRIDTNKQLVQYREIIDSANNLYGNWIGVNSVLYSGNLFKLPPSAEWQYLHINTEDFKATNFSINYRYLYI